MTLPASGELHISQINDEFGLPWNQAIEINNQSVRNLAGTGTGNGQPISMDQFRGKSAYTPTVFYTVLHSQGGFGGDDYIMGYVFNLGYGSMDAYVYRGYYIRGIYETGGRVYFVIDGYHPQNFFNRIVLEGYQTFWWNGATSFTHDSGVSTWMWNYSSSTGLQNSNNVGVTIREVG